jgi:hypothetical protein
MAALTAASWTVTLTERWMEGPKRYSRGTIALAGTDTYPTAGVPLPTKDKFGMVRQLDDLRFIGQSTGTTQYLTNYDPTNNKMLFYEEEAAAAGGPLLECDTAEVPGARTYHFVAVGW